MKMDNGMSIILLVLCTRYEDMAKCLNKSENQVMGMIDSIRENYPSMTIDKANRWIGFIQGILFSEGILDIDTERNYTRPLYHAYYKDLGLPVPKTIDI